MNTYNPNTFSKSPNSSNRVRNIEESEIQLTEVFKKVVYHWPLFVLLLILSFIGARLYLRYTKPVFSSSTKVYIKDEKKSGTAGKQSSALEDFSLLGGSKLVENEMELIKSPLILQEVITEHQFNIRYFAKGRVREYEMYQNSPFKLLVLSDSGTVGNYFFDITLQSNQNIEIKYTDIVRGPVTIRSRYNQSFSAGKDLFAVQYFPNLNTQKINRFNIKVDSIPELAYLKAGQLTTALVNKQSSVFEMGYEDNIAKRSADFLNAVTAKYNEFTLDDKNKTALNTIKFIESRLQSLGGELNILERDVETFKKNRGITEIKESSQLFLEQIKDADQKLGEANIELSVYDQIEKYITNNPNTTAFMPVIGNVDPALTSLINNYQTGLAEKKKLSLSLQPNNPILENIDQQLTETKGTIKNYIAGYRRNAATAKKGLQSKVNQIEGMIAQVPSYERQFINLSRQKSVKEALYLFLLQKREESAVSSASNMVDNKIISPAFIPNKPISPNKPLVVMGFLFGGLFIGAGYLFIKHLINNRVVSKKDIEKALALPIVAEVFKQENQKGAQFFNLEPRSILTEQMLNLKANLKFFLNSVHHSPVILSTSSISGEGKTFLSAHLGNSFTGNGKKVVMLELDLRKPKLASTLGISNQSGITNYLLGQACLDKIIKKVGDNDNLYLIPSGPIPPNPVELLESDKMKELIELLKTKFDYVIIDTAPLGLVSDAKSLAVFVDCVLFVTRFNYTPKAKLLEMKDSLDTADFKKVGIIFNGIEQGTSYGYSNYGYSNYGYGYVNANGKKSNFLMDKLVKRLY